MGRPISPIRIPNSIPAWKANGKADALTRRSGDLPKEGDKRGRPFQAILDPM